LNASKFTGQGFYIYVMIDYEISVDVQPVDISDIGQHSGSAALTETFAILRQLAVNSLDQSIFGNVHGKHLSGAREYPDAPFVFEFI
jgi:hypothetical protein